MPLSARCVFALVLVFSCCHRALTQSVARDEGKIAFLFLTRGSMPFEEIWHEFFTWNAHPSQYTIYVHTSIFDFQYPTDSIFFNRTVRTVPTGVSWGGFGQVYAMQRLVKEALNDPLNERFCLMSESCIPLVPFSKWRRIMLSHEKSILNACPMPWVEMEGNTRWRPGLDAVQFKREHWRKSANWFALNRKHATLFATENSTIPGWQEVPNVDEHYLPSLIAMHGMDNDTTCSDGFAYVHWPSADAMHPQLYRGFQINRPFIEKMQQPESEHFTKSQFSQLCSGYSELCHFTGRKFHQSAIVSAIQHLPMLLRDGNVTYDRNPWLRYGRNLRRKADNSYFYFIENQMYREIYGNETLVAFLKTMHVRDINSIKIFDEEENRRLRYTPGPDYALRKEGWIYKTDESSEVWYIWHGHKHLIPNIDMFNKMGLKMWKLKKITVYDLDMIPTGHPADMTMVLKK